MTRGGIEMEARHWAALGTVLAVGLGMRLWGLDYGLPLVVHPDENRQVLDALGMVRRMSPVPRDYSYPALHKFIVAGTSSVVYLAGRASGWFAAPADFVLSFLSGESGVFYAARLASVAAGIGVAGAAFFSAHRLFGRRAGLMAAVFATFMYHLVQHSQWALGDIFLALFTLLSLHYTMLAATESDDPAHVMKALVFIGLAVATKPQGVFLLAPFAVSQVFALSERSVPLGEFIKTRLPGAAVFVAVSVAGNLHWVADFPGSLEKFRMLSQVAHLGISSREPFEPGLPGLIWWFCVEMVRQEGPLGATLLGGVGWAAYRRKREDLVFLAYLLIFFLAMRGWAIRYLHLFVALMPVLCVFGARFAAEALGGLRLRPAFAAALALAVVSPSVAASVEASVTKSSTDTRLEAKAWFERNVSAGSTVAVDWYEFSVPLWNGTPPYMLNPRAKRAYREQVPGEVRRGYGNFVARRPNYELVPVIHTTSGPTWPPDMPEEAVERASSKEVYRELYSVFNFTSVEELKARGVEYLVISSYGYTNFLLDTDPAKTDRAVFNYLFTEDLLSFNSQADHYIKNSPFGLLYFLNRRARDFYEPLLRGRADAELVAEFSPARFRPGPVIRVFRLRDEPAGEESLRTVEGEKTDRG